MINRRRKLNEYKKSGFFATDFWHFFFYSIKKVKVASTCNIKIIDFKEIGTDINFLFYRNINLKNLVFFWAVKDSMKIKEIWW